MKEIQLPKKEEIKDLSFAQGLENINDAIENIIDIILHDQGEVIKDTIITNSPEKKRAVLVDLNKKFHACKKVIADIVITIMKSNPSLRERDMIESFAIYEADYLLAATKNEMRKISDLFSFSSLVGSTEESPLKRDEALKLQPSLILDVTILANSITPLFVRAMLLALREEKKKKQHGEFNDIFDHSEKGIRKHLRV